MTQRSHTCHHLNIPTPQALSGLAQIRAMLSTAAAPSAGNTTALFGFDASTCLAALREDIQQHVTGERRCGPGGHFRGLLQGCMHYLLTLIASRTFPPPGPLISQLETSGPGGPRGLSFAVGVNDTVQLRLLRPLVLEGDGMAGSKPRLERATAMVTEALQAAQAAAAGGEGGGEQERESAIAGL